MPLTGGGDGTGRSLPPRGRLCLLPKPQFKQSGVISRSARARARTCGEGIACHSMVAEESRDHLAIAPRASSPVLPATVASPRAYRVPAPKLCFRGHLGLAWRNKIVLCLVEDCEDLLEEGLALILVGLAENLDVPELAKVEVALLLEPVHSELEVGHLELQLLLLGGVRLGGGNGAGGLHILLLCGGDSRGRPSRGAAELLGLCRLDARLLESLLRVVVRGACSNLVVVEDLHPLDELEIHLERIRLAQLLHLDVSVQLVLRESSLQDLEVVQALVLLLGAELDLGQLHRARVDGVNYLAVHRARVQVLDPLDAGLILALDPGYDFFSAGEVGLVHHADGGHGDRLPGVLV
mmetsp:Transcript_12639/g.37137  ORF Transcript_12639/g.37137 Transcript_12639/m.37137 type:complete len:352 (+) Transcript_12639:179-1234(+)|eukprot:CAMPEP_0206043172 /NCGR_PEP_ID=MMETSP1466-20131121/7977_1 /ASSEMBLY_ACC=CAM_ASM_001126 /TAXON_ID=44452 /ORGANISM="Pavlova gyrans, Strain CCMP608" /LENGTH=351 /DNA_ID=CAMNT_0053417945 /DNA_START=88 /DNA_END=1143 /DNA_ORIENTATION=-